MSRWKPGRSGTGWGIWITDNRTGKTIAEWWDEDAREMFEQGFFKPGCPPAYHREAVQGVCR